MISRREQDELDERGLLRLGGLVPAAVTSRARDALRSELERLGLRGGGKWHLRALEGVPTFQLAARVARNVRALPAFDALITAELRACVDLLAGTPLVAAQQHPSLLITPPQKQAWSLPHADWHVDVATLERRLPGIQAFVLVDDVATKGGATMALAGSHRLAGSPSGRQRALREHAVWGELFVEGGAGREDLFRASKIGDVELQVVEMCGRAGDVYLMDMRVLHSPSTNASKNARVSATCRYLRR